VSQSKSTFSKLSLRSARFEGGGGGASLGNSSWMFSVNAPSLTLQKVERSRLKRCGQLTAKSNASRGIISTSTLKARDSRERLEDVRAEVFSSEEI